MISKRVVFTLILILLFLGIIYASQKKVTIEIYANTLHPNNTDKFGTSKFSQYLSELGYEVLYGDIYDYPSSVYDLYILIGPDKVVNKLEARQIIEYLLNGGNAIIASERDDIFWILRELDIYMSYLYNLIELGKTVSDPHFKIYCATCRYFDTLYLDIPGSFIIGFSKSELETGKIEILDLGEKYLKYRFNGDIK